MVPRGAGWCRSPATIQPDPSSLRVLALIFKSALAEHLSGDIADMFDSHDFVYVHVKSLKKKLSAAVSVNDVRNVYGSS